MKKVLLFTFIALITTNVCYAEKNWFDIEVSKIRQAKELQVNIINDELKDIEIQKAQILSDSGISPSIRAQQVDEFNRRTQELTAQKTYIEEQYKKDKAELKRRWKNGDTKNTDTYSRYNYNTPARNEYKTTLTTTTREYTPVNNTTTYNRYEYNIPVQKTSEYKTVTTTTKEVTKPVSQKTTVTTKTIEKRIPNSIELQPKPQPEFKVILH
ncbi:hypothetical protein IJ182_05495 [bacterium]|nr:hypothetical protein [bacterium]